MLSLLFDRQKDIGLVKYETKILFLHLFYPTLLVVITVVQLQMFHKKYLEHLELPSLINRDSSDSGIQPASSINYGSFEPESSSEEQPKTKSRHTRLNVSDLKNLTTKQVGISEHSLKVSNFIDFVPFLGSEESCFILQ